MSHGGISRGGAAVLTIVASAGVLLLALLWKAREPAQRASAEQPAPTRWLRDTFPLEKSFADAFPGTAEKALSAFRAAAAERSVDLLKDAALALSADKRTLTLVSPRIDDMERAGVPHFLREAGWSKVSNHELMSARMRQVDVQLAGLRQEVEKLRKRIEEAYRKMVSLRELHGIHDPDAERMEATVSIAGRNLAELEPLVRQMAAVAAPKMKLALLSEIPAEQMDEILEALERKDDELLRIFGEWEEVVEKDAVLASLAVAENDMQRKPLRTRSETLRAALRKTHAALRAELEAALAVETAKLHEAQARTRVTPGAAATEQAFAEYLEAKATYLGAKRRYAAGQVKLATRSLEFSQ